MWRNRACLTDDSAASLPQAWDVEGQLVNTARWLETLMKWNRWRTDADFAWSLSAFEPTRSEEQDAPTRNNRQPL
jgi:hypothetical protein